MTHRSLLVVAAIAAISATIGVHRLEPQTTEEGPGTEHARRLVARRSTPPPLDAIAPSALQLKALMLDDFPYQAQDFASDERVFRGKPIHNPDNPNSTWQQFAYDLGASRQEPNGSWRDTKPTIDWGNPKKYIAIWRQDP